MDENLSLKLVRLSELQARPQQERQDRKRFEFLVLGEPVPQGRPRTNVPALQNLKQGKPITVRDCIPIVYDPKESREWKQTIKYAAQRKVEETGHQIWRETALVVVATFFLLRPKSLPKRIKYPIKKPDDDNLMAAVQNALEGVVYVNDSAIVDKHVKKRFHPEGRCGVHVIVQAME